MGDTGRSRGSVRENSGPEAGKSLTSGAIAGLASVFLLQPLDVVKTRLQELPRSGRTPPFMRLENVLRGTLRSDGLMGFWRGTIPTVLRNVPGVAIYFVTLNQLQYLTLLGWHRSLPLFDRLYDGHRERLTIVGNLLAGAAARTWAGSILMPVTILKVRFESARWRDTYGGTGGRSILAALGQIKTAEGWRGLFRGLGVTALRDAPHAGLYLTFYEGLKPWVINVNGQGSESQAGGRLVAGMLAGLMATTCTQPFDLLKTKIQLAPATTGGGAWRCLREVWGREGLAGLFNGMGPRLLRKSLSSALTWTVYEEIITWWRRIK